MPRLILDDFVPYRLSYTSNRMSEAIARTYKSMFGLTIPEWRVVAVVAERSGTTQQAICARTGMDKVTISRATLALVGRGLLARTASPSDRRAHQLSLTAAGNDLYADVAPKALELEAAIFGAFDPAELATFVAMLRRIDEAVDSTATGESPG